ncbi:hypothetical protein ACFX19_018075 [Malus domestica]
MDLVYGLPSTWSRFDGIWMIVGRLTKTTHFLPVRHNYTLQKLAHLFIDNIVKVHSVPVTIVSNRDLRFNSRFWRAFYDAMNTQFLYSTAYHLQTNDQSEKTIQRHAKGVCSPMEG